MSVRPHRPHRPREFRFDDREAMAAAMADDIADLLRAAIDDRGRASLAVSGGSTPEAMFRCLSEQRLAWERVVVTLVDERWVPPDAKDSNERLARAALLQGPAGAARFVGLKNAAATPEDGLAETERALRDVPRPFDVMVLGMGDDGHTASLFPGTTELAAALSPASSASCAPVRPEWLQPRMTLTLPAILDSRYILLLLAGRSKWDVYEQALAGTDATVMPIRAVFAQARAPLEVYWAP
ncbi:MAG TPA: 6-phosphogluconolactonase [Haliangium sp.]|nr:6-phosphogluconolactonase [Haliangium sp.]